MRITIDTGKGYMNVDLAAFFPNSITKTRKLFRLISAGCGRQDQEAARVWMVQRGAAAAAVREETANLQKQLESLEKERERLKERVREAEGALRLAEQMERQSPVWVKEFDRICGE